MEWSAQVNKLIFLIWLLGRWDIFEDSHHIALFVKMLSRRHDYLDVPKAIKCSQCSCICMQPTPAWIGCVLAPEKARMERSISRLIRIGYLTQVNSSQRQIQFISWHTVITNLYIWLSTHTCDTLWYRLTKIVMFKSNYNQVEVQEYRYIRALNGLPKRDKSR